MSKPNRSAAEAAQRWLLLVHQLPSQPAYFRVKVWRRLQALGAVAVKNSVYALPAGEQTQEDFEWLLKEVVEGGGEGLICEARLVDGLSDEQIRGVFNHAREADYDALANDLRAFAETLAADGEGNPGDPQIRLGRLRARLGQIAALDFFGANGRETVEGLLGALETRLRDKEADMEKDEAPHVAAGPESLKGRLWVTRRGVYVDRIASAWLIQRFIDPDARFKFVSAKGYEPEPGELRFDMFDGEFTHEGDRCTFEVLLARTGLNDPALTAIGQIVHDIDLKDRKYGRDEAGGIARLIEGIAAANRDDRQRIDRGTAIFNDLYEVFGRKRAR
jgi:hypothetical protein